jgi:CBS domain containing-hemolysin-like protein
MGVVWMISSEFWLTSLKLASVPFLVLLNGFFVAAEFALVKIVTLENVVEELVGSIEDEFHHDETRIRRTGRGTWEIKGSSPVRTLGELIGRPLEETTGASTVSGLVIQRLGRFPRPGDVLALNGSELRVEQVAGTRITRIKLTRLLEDVGAVSRETPATNAPTYLDQAEPAKADLEHSKMAHAA